MPSASPSPRRFLHPASGVLILGLDWLLFSGNVLTLGLSTFVLGTLGFLVATTGTGWIQARYSGDSRGKSLMKGLLGGVAVGVPFPIVGTAVGGAILALSGLRRRPGQADGPSQNNLPSDTHDRP